MAEHRIPLHVWVDRIPYVCSACIESNSRKKVSAYLFSWLPCKSDNILHVFSPVSTFPVLGGWTQSNGYGWLVPHIYKASDAWLVGWITSIGRVNCMYWEGRKAISSIQWGREGFVPPPKIWIQSNVCMISFNSLLVWMWTLPTCCLFWMSSPVVEDGFPCMYVCLHSLHSYSIGSPRLVGRIWPMVGEVMKPLLGRNHCLNN